MTLQPFAGRWAIFEDKRVSSWVGNADQSMPAFGGPVLREVREATARQFGLSTAELSEPLVTVLDGGVRQVEFRQLTGGLPIVDAGVLLRFGADGRLIYVRETFLPSPGVPPKPDLPFNIDAFVRRAIAGVISSEGGVLYVRSVTVPFLYAAEGTVHWTIKAYIEVIRNSTAPPVPYDVIIELSRARLLAVIHHLHQAGPDAQVFRHAKSATQATAPTPLALCTSQEYATVSLAPDYQKVELVRLSRGATNANGAYVLFKNLDGMPNPPWSAPCNGAGVCDFRFKWLDQAVPLEQQKFSEVMTYFFVDEVLHYVQSDLGFTTIAVDRPIAVDVVADAGLRLAFYLHKPATKKGLYFGLNSSHSVATDGKAIVHEYAHALQAADVGDRLSQTGDPIGIREGFGDYFAISTFASRETDECRPQIAAFTNGGAGIRNVLFAQRYPPTFNANDAHERGLVWAAALFRALGTVRSTSTWEAARRVVDRGAFLGHQAVGKTSSVPTMPEMAKATLAAVRADAQISTHFDAFCDGFEQQNILQAGSCAAMKALPVVVPPLPP